jgi:branched-chain amino acid transport system substrate-binding protein
MESNRRNFLPGYWPFEIWTHCNLLVLLFLSFPLICTLEIAFAAPHSSRKPVLGVILPLTGKAAAAGEAVKNGMLIANESLDAPIDIHFEDNQLDNARTASIAKQYINVEKVDGLIVYASGPAHVVAPLAESARVPMIAISVDPRVSKDKAWVMIHWASNQKVADRLFDELKKRNLSRIAVVTTEVQGLLDMEEYFLTRARERGLTITNAQRFLPTEVDFRTPVLAIKKQQPDAIFVNLYYGQASEFSKQVRAQGIRLQLFSQFVLDDDSEVKNASGALEGAFFATTATGDGSFDKEYLQKFGKRAALGGIASYDIILLFAQALQNHTSRDVTMKALRNVRRFQGKIGLYDALPNGSFDVPAELRVIKRGVPVRE